MPKQKMILKPLPSVGQIIGEVVRPLDSERLIVKASSGPRYVVGCRSKVDKEKLTAGTRVVICAEAEKVFNQDLYFKKTVKYVGEPMSHLESIASSAVRAAIKVKASIIICFTSSGRAARYLWVMTPNFYE